METFMGKMEDSWRFHGVFDGDFLLHSWRHLLWRFLGERRITSWWGVAPDKQLGKTWD